MYSQYLTETAICKLRFGLLGLIQMNFIQSRTFRLYLLSIFICLFWVLIQWELTLVDIKILLPLLFSFLIIFSYKIYLEKFNKVFAYILFFSISFTSIFGITNVMDGSFALSTNPILYGLAFYSVFFAFHVYKKSLNMSFIWIAANPLLLITGPIAFRFKSINYIKLKQRLSYYFPFFLIGVVFFKIIATPLTPFFELINSTNAIEVLVFGIIFELFVYFNFCGLSLIIYAIFGVLGLKIPLNFKQPFSSRNIIDYWRGWHRSLSYVLKHLFYLPVRNKYSINIALFVVFLSSALWHGVSVNFMLWGAFHALCFIVSVKFLKKDLKLLSLFLMVFSIIVGRVIFSETDLDRLILKLSFSFNSPTELFNLFENIPAVSFISLLLATLWISLEFFLKDIRFFRERSYKFLRIPILQIMLMIIFILLVGSEIGIEYAVYNQR